MRRLKIAGFVLGLLVAGMAGGVALASSSTMSSIQVSFENIGMDINGQPASSAAQPFLYNGHVYLPIRYVAEDMNVPVSWDASTHTVYVGTQPAGQTTDLSAINGDLSTGTCQTCSSFTGSGFTFINTGMPGYFTVNGTSYSDGLNLGTGGAGTVSETWSLGGDYTSLAASIGIDDNFPNAATVTFTGDGKTLASYSLTPGASPQPITVNLTGVSSLEMSVTTSSSSGAAVDLLNPVLTPTAP